MDSVIPWAGGLGKASTKAIGEPQSEPAAAFLHGAYMQAPALTSHCFLGPWSEEIHLTICSSPWSPLPPEVPKQWGQTSDCGLNWEASKPLSSLKAGHFQYFMTVTKADGQKKKRGLVIGCTVMSKITHSIKRQRLYRQLRSLFRVKKPRQDDLDKPGSINRVWASLYTNARLSLISQIFKFQE